jgi:hypothetical protein
MRSFKRFRGFHKRVHVFLTVVKTVQFATNSISFPSFVILADLVILCVADFEGAARTISRRKKLKIQF